MCRLAEERGHYAGYPLPDDKFPLSVAPAIAKLLPKLDNFRTGDDKHGLAEFLLEARSRIPADATDEEISAAINQLIEEYLEQKSPAINSWINRKYDCRVTIRHTAEGRARCYMAPAKPEVLRLSLVLDSLQCSRNQSYSGELRALRLLRKLLRDQECKFRDYFLTGSFLERSPRSGVVYLLRKARPTLALKSVFDEQGKDLGTRALCALCMHPVAYYQGTFTGGMCPTDEVIAHLLMIRGDEHLYWRRCNQHPVEQANSGL